LIACGKNRIFFVAKQRISKRIFGISFINANFQKLFFYGMIDRKQCSAASPSATDGYENTSL